MKRTEKNKYRKIVLNRLIKLIEDYRDCGTSWDNLADLTTITEFEMLENSETVLDFYEKSIDIDNSNSEKVIAELETHYDWLLKDY